MPKHIERAPQGSIIRVKDGNEEILRLHVRAKRGYVVTIDKPPKGKYRQSTENSVESRCPHKREPR